MSGIVSAINASQRREFGIAAPAPQARKDGFVNQTLIIRLLAVIIFNMVKYL